MKFKSLTLKIQTEFSEFAISLLILESTTNCVMDSSRKSNGEVVAIRPVELLYEVRKSVSKTLGRRFTKKIDHQIFQPDKKILALWAADCAERVLPYFERRNPKDDRPRNAIETCRKWAVTGIFRMVEIRNASLGAHSAAKGLKKDYDAIAAAHAAGQAVSTPHVPTHALGSSIYAIRAVAAHTGNVTDGLVKERNWQLRRLQKYVNESKRKEEKTIIRRS